MLKRLSRVVFCCFLFSPYRANLLQATNASRHLPAGAVPDPIGTGCLIQVEVPGGGGGAGQPGGDGSQAGGAIPTSSDEVLLSGGKGDPLPGW